MKEILLALFFFQVFISCEKEGVGTTELPYLQFYQAKISIPANVSGSADFVVQSNTDWELLVSSGSDWLQLSKSSGHGTDTIHVSVAGNVVAGQPRTAIVTAKVANASLNLKAELTIEQKAFDVELLSQKILAGKLTNYFNAITADPAGGFLCVGTNNFTGFPGIGFGDAWIVKCNNDGDTLWTRTMGNKTEDDAAKAVIPTSDGGFIVGATSFGYQRPGRSDWWIIKMQSNGDTAWTRVVGTPDYYEYLTSMVPASNGDFIVAGIKSTPVNNIQITKFDRNGNTIWDKYLDEFIGGNTRSMSVTPDGSIYVSLGTSGGDYGIVKLNANGEKIWSKVLGSNKGDDPLSIQSTADGGCIVAGTSYGSENGDVTGKNHSSYTDLWIVKLDANGNMSWNKLLGGSSNDFYSSNAGIALTPDGGYVFAAIAGVQDGDVGTNQQNGGTWLFKLNNSGQLLWSKAFASPNGNQANGLLMNSDGSFWVAGSVNSTATYPSDDHSDGWLMKFKEN
ncbi:BACON domain-containing protein [Niastella koreensis]|nr:BACON domain-containing protein [Niastella koreensis]